MTDMYLTFDQWSEKRKCVDRDLSFGWRLGRTVRIPVVHPPYAILCTEGRYLYLKAGFDDDPEFAKWRNRWMWAEHYARLAVRDGIALFQGEGDRDE